MLRIINSDDQNVYSVKWLKTETGPTKKKDDSKLYYIAIYLDLSNYDCNKPADDQTNGLHKDLLVLIDEPFSSFQNAMDEMVDYSKHAFSEIQTSKLINKAIPDGFYWEYFDLLIVQFDE